jgi:hypothetical protein
MNGGFCCLASLHQSLFVNGIFLSLFFVLPGDLCFLQTGNQLRYWRERGVYAFICPSRNSTQVLCEISC